MITVNFTMGADGVFRLVVTRADDLQIETRCLDRKDAVSWRPAKLDSAKIIPRVLTQALLLVEHTRVPDIDLGDLS